MADNFKSAQCYGIDECLPHKVFIRDFPAISWRKFRALCELEGKGTREKLVELLDEATAHLPYSAKDDDQEPEK